MTPAPRRLRRVLVANRGEIARRVIRGAHDAGLEAAAVYAPDDAGAPYVAEADLAVPLDGHGLGETYLDPGAVTAAAVRAGADCLHPGYGFLSENPALPEACAEAGLVWVGPSPAAMRTMGHKVRAKETVAAAGVPVLPSATLTDTTGGAELARAGGDIGFPLLVKAAAGGGGRGMRAVAQAADLAEAVEAAQREAAAAFGSPEVYLERHLLAPRHIEVQVLGDQRGSVVHLFDRECSVQRRHQKIVEEAPAVLVPPATRARMWEAAVAAARAVHYEGAGTVEFLVEGEEFFFLEMNTRLQVEHGVTELVTGLDLVGLQFSVAAGHALAFTQEQVTASGHAMEVRLCAERPRQDYRPTPGTVHHVRWPGGAGLRVDAAVEDGTVVGAAYDSLVAKLMAHGPDREGARDRLARALRALELDGLETNRDLLDAVLHDDVFRQGAAHIDYLESRPDLAAAVPAHQVRRRHAAAGAFALLSLRAARSLVPLPVGAWRNVGRAREGEVLEDGAGRLAVRVGRPTDTAEVRDGDEPDARWEPVGTAQVANGAVDLLADGVRRRYEVRCRAEQIAVNGPEGQITFDRPGHERAGDAGAVTGECRAPLPGSVGKVLVQAGHAVDEGQGLVVLEAMKMEHTLRAGAAGTVTEVRCAPGQQVEAGDLLVLVAAP